MGKNIIPQARGKGGPRYRSPGHNFAGAARNRRLNEEPITGTVIDLINCPGHSAPLVYIQYEDGEECLSIAPEGIRVGEQIVAGNNESNTGNLLYLEDIPEGTAIYNIESQPGDGGKFCRSSGTFAKVMEKTRDGIIVRLPSKKQKLFKKGCRACIGIVAGSGRTEKPFLKAGFKHKLKKARNKLYPKVSGGAMNAVDHPFGNKRSSRKSNAKPISRNAPPGRKVGMVAAKRTGRTKR